MNLNYRKYGTGPALIILHGLFGSSDNWHTLANRWSQFFTVYTLDQRNHGGSPHESVMNYEEMVNDLKHFMDRERLSSAYLLGHSMGGKVALQFSSLYPDIVDGLAVLDIGIDAVKGQHQPILEVLQGINPNDFSERRDLQQEFAGFIKSPSIIQFLLKNIIRRVDGSLSWKFNQDALLDHYADLVAAITLSDTYMGPVLFLRGGNSSYLEPELSAEVLQYFPLAQISTIENAGHWLHAERADDVFIQVKDFFISP